jgi:hypothetical protein
LDGLFWSKSADSADTLNKLVEAGAEIAFKNLSASLLELE